MNIQTTHIKPYSNCKPLARAYAQHNEVAVDTPKDEFTFSGNRSPVFPLVGAGVMMTGMMVAAQMGNPVIAMGAMFGGAAIMMVGS